MKLTIKQAAEQTNFARSTIAHAIKREQKKVGTGLPAQRLGNQWFIEETDLLEWANDPKMHQQGKRAVGEISQQQAADMLGLKTRGGASWLVGEGKLPRALTAEAVVEFALGRGKHLVYKAHDRLYGASGDEEIFTLGYVTSNRIKVQRLDFADVVTLLDAMKQIAPLTEWRVVKG